MRVFQFPARLPLWLVATVPVLALAGCTEPTAVVERPRAASTAAQPTQAAMNIDQAFLAISDRVPSFAGAYFDERGMLVVRLQSVADSASAWSALREALIARVRVDERRIAKPTADDQLIPNGRRVEQASVGFRQLYDLKEKLSASAFDNKAVVSLDLDERTGHVTVGLSDVSASARVRDNLRLTGSESPLVEIKFQQASTPARQQTVNWRHRPLSGGYSIGPTECTMTLGAMRGSEQLMLTASHCSASAFTLDGGPTRQNFNQAQTFGAEVTDPQPYGCGTWFNPKTCRRAEATAYNAANVDLFGSDSIGWVPGRIARTYTAANGLSQANGSFQIDPAYPYWTVITEIAYPLQGENLHKVGISSGWTYGTVFATCKDEQWFGTNLRIVCNDEANIFGKPGDSGSPIFAPYGGYVGTVAFYGLLWGIQLGSSVVVFSNFTQMKQDLGYLRLF